MHVITVDGNPQYEALRQRLEASYEFHTEQLTGLTARPMNDAEEAFTNLSLAATSRQALADIATALRNMAEDRYGQCEGCHEAIPPERLEVRPDARFCVACQVLQRR